MGGLTKVQTIIFGMFGAAIGFVITTYATQIYVDIKHESNVDKISYLHDDIKEMKADIKELIRRK